MASKSALYPPKQIGILSAVFVCGEIGQSCAEMSPFGISVRELTKRLPQTQLMENVMQKLYI